MWRGLIKKIYDEIRGNPKKYEGSLKRHPMKKRQQKKTQMGSQKDLRRKRGNPKNAKGLIKNTSVGKRGNTKIAPT
jgi:hypothetical protein